MELTVCVGGNGGLVERKVLEDKAAERELAPGVEQRRDESGQFVSHAEVPVRVAGRAR